MIRILITIGTLWFSANLHAQVRPLAHPDPATQWASFSIQSLNFDGTIGFGSYQTGPGLSKNLVFWDTQNSQVLTSAGFLPWDEHLKVFGMSDSGDRVLISRVIDIDREQAVVIDRATGAWQWLSLGGWDSVHSGVLSADGEVVYAITLNLSTFSGTVVRYDLGTPTPVNLCAPAECDFRPLATNVDGSVLLAYRIVSGQFEAGLWTAAQGFQVLDSFPWASLSGGPHGALNHDGTVAFFNGPNQTVRRWTLAGGSTTLVAPTALALNRPSSSPDGLSLRSRDHAWTQQNGWTDLIQETTALHSPLNAGLATLQFILVHSGDHKSMIGAVETDGFSGGNYPGYFFMGASPSNSQVGMTVCAPGAPNSTEIGGIIRAEGSPVVSDQNLSLTAEFLPADQFGFFINGTQEGFVAYPAGSKGYLCVGGSIGRHNSVSDVGWSGATGSFTIDLDLSAVPSLGAPVAVIAGETRTFQAWYRDMDSLGNSTNNFTDAIAITFE